MERVEEHYIDLLYDPQTSGGLLISVSPEYVDDIMKAFEGKKYGHKGVGYRESSRKRR